MIFFLFFLKNSDTSTINNKFHRKAPKKYKVTKAASQSKTLDCSANPLLVNWMPKKKLMYRSKYITYLGP